MSSYELLETDEKLELHYNPKFRSLSGDGIEIQINNPVFTHKGKEFETETLYFYPCSNNNKGALSFSSLLHRKLYKLNPTNSDLRNKILEGLDINLSSWSLEEKLKYYAEKKLIETEILHKNDNPVVFFNFKNTVNQKFKDELKQKLINANDRETQIKTLKDLLSKFKITVFPEDQLENIQIDFNHPKAFSKIKLSLPQEHQANKWLAPGIKLEIPSSFSLAS